MLQNSLTVLAFGCVSLFCCSGAGQENRRRSSQDPPAIENAVFLGITSRTKITRRFEIYDPHSLEDLQAVKAMGFDQVILDRANLHPQAAATGLDVVIANWWNQDTPQETIDQALATAAEVMPGRLIGISVQDEPERNSPDTPFQYYVDLYEKLKPHMVAELRGARLEISYWGPLPSWDQRYYDYFSYLYEAADAMRIMPYPDLFEAPLSEVYLMLQRSKRAMEIAQVDIPQVVILQTWVLPPEDKLPTIPELRVMAYQAMLGGAETLSFFEYNPALWAQTPGFSAGFSALMRELRQLSARLADANLETALHPNGILTSKAVWPSGGSSEIRVNTNRHAVEDMAGLQILDGSVTTLRMASSAPSETLDLSPGCQCIECNRRFCSGSPVKACQTKSLETARLNCLRAGPRTVEPRNRFRPFRLLSRVAGRSRL